MKSSTGTTSRRTVGTTGQRSERTSSRRSGNDTKPLRRTPGTEEDDEIAVSVTICAQGSKGNVYPQLSFGRSNRFVVNIMYSAELFSGGASG